MKKKIFSIFAMLGTASMLCGFDNAQTADSIIQKQQEAVASATSVDADIAVNADIDIDFAGAQLSALADGTIDLALMLDGPALKIESSFDLLSPLMAQEDKKEYKLYITKNDAGSPEFFIYEADSVTGESNWDHNTEEGVNLDVLMSSIPTITPEKLSKIGISFDLAGEAATIDGKECYHLTSVVESSTFTALVFELSELTGQDITVSENYDMVRSVLEALRLNIEYYIDADTYLPVQMHLDLNDSELDIFEQLLETYVSTVITDEENLNIELLVNNLSADITTTYNTVSEIVVPQEAIDAGAEKDTIPDEVEAEMAGAIENLTEISGE